VQKAKLHHPANGIRSRFPSAQPDRLLALVCASCLAVAPAAGWTQTAKLTPASPNAATRKLPSDSAIEHFIKKTLAEQVGSTPEQVTGPASLQDLGADSLDIVEFIMQLDEHFELDIPAADSRQLLTVDDFIAYIKGRVHKKRTSAGS
jgi:acyl carrier protein